MKFRNLVVGSTNELNDSKCYNMTMHSEIYLTRSQLPKTVTLKKINIKTKKKN